VAHVMSSADRPERTAPPRVVIVGGGAAGVITAVHLLRKADAEHPVDVHIVERRSVLGPGLAYRTTHPLHTLNNFAGRLSAIDGDPDHLLRWCEDTGVAVSPTAFLQRATYGRYLRETLDDTTVPRGSALRRTCGVVTAVIPDGDEVAVTLSDGRSIRADVVILALGNPPPRPQPAFERLGERYICDPWCEDLADRIGGVPEVLVLGTGLTMIDAVAQLHEAFPRTRFTAVSRHGLMPKAHRPTSSRVRDLFDPGSITSLEALQERVRARIDEIRRSGGDWRDVVDSLRPCANELWQCLPPDDQDRFVADHARHWELARHRLSPQMATHVRALQRAGTLRVARIEEVDVFGFDRVLNCTGPAPVPTQGWNSLVDSLMDAGMIRPNRLGLGLDLDRDGRVVDDNGHSNPCVHVVGAARRGMEWEVTAIPDLRCQAARLTARIVRGAQGGSEDAPAILTA